MKQATFSTTQTLSTHTARLARQVGAPDDRNGEAAACADDSGWASRVSDHPDESRMPVTEKTFGFLLKALVRSNSFRPTAQRRRHPPRLPASPQPDEVHRPSIGDDQ